MTKGNGKIRQKGIDHLDPERELPESDESSSEQPDTQQDQAQAAAAPSSEFEAQIEKLRVESVAYLDRLLACKPSSTISASAWRGSSRSIASTLWPKL